MICPLYCNAVLANLNSRDHIRGLGIMNKSLSNVNELAKIEFKTPSRRTHSTESRTDVDYTVSGGTGRGGSSIGYSPKHTVNPDSRKFPLSQEMANSQAV